MTEFENSLFYIERHEAMVAPNILVTRISEGLGYGDGAISGNPEGEADVLAAVDELIQSPAILAAVDTDDNGDVITDDGCGDGRGVSVIFKLNERLKRSLNRSKVFGGGVAMAAAASIGLGEVRGKSLTQIFKRAASALNVKGIDYGAHTAEHVPSAADSGCGAIDGAPEVLQHVVHYKEQIRATIPHLGLSYEGLEDDLNEVLENYERAAEEAVGQTFSGKDIVETIIESGKIVKQLAGTHKERRILLNKVRGYTVNQKLVRETTDEAAQVFAVDLWRLEDIANSLYDGQLSQQRKALLSEIVYTLGVATLLTAGDLPIDVIEEAPVAIAA